MSGENPQTGDVTEMLDRAANALSELVEGTDSAISELRDDLGRRRATGQAGDVDEIEMLEAVLQRTEAARTDTLGLVAVMRRARAGLLDRPGATAAAAGLAAEPKAVPPVPSTPSTPASPVAPAVPVVAQAPESAVVNAPDVASAVADTVDGPDTEPALEPVGAAEPDAVPDIDAGDGDETGEGALLLATQMAVAGSSRDDIERCLADFGVANTRSVLERVFGY